MIRRPKQLILDKIDAVQEQAPLPSTTNPTTSVDGDRSDPGQAVRIHHMMFGRVRDDAFDAEAYVSNTRQEGRLRRFERLQRTIKIRRGGLLPDNPQEAKTKAATSAPTTVSTLFVTVPDMSRAVEVKRSNTKVMVIATCASSNSGANTNTFALFRNGQQISTSTSSSTASSVTCMAVDTPPAGFHIYDLRWLTTGGTATATGTQRELIVHELRIV